MPTSRVLLASCIDLDPVVLLYMCILCLSILLLHVLFCYLKYMQFASISLLVFSVFEILCCLVVPLSFFLDLLGAEMRICNKVKDLHDISMSFCVSARRYINNEQEYEYGVLFN